MASPARPLGVVSTPQTVPDTFAARVQQVVDEHGDVASEATWQAFSRVIVAYWQELCRDQGPAQTWTMMTRATETIIRIRRGQQQDKGQSAGDALEEFRSFMGEVTGKDEQG